MNDSAYSDDDLVYVDPEARSVLGTVEWDDAGNPKSLPFKSETGKQMWRKICPWGTYRSMKGVYRIEGKRVYEDGDLSLDEALPKLLNDAI